MGEDREKYPSELKFNTKNKNQRYRLVKSPAEPDGAPVYSLGEGASPATPSGDVLVRFAKGTAAADQKPALAKAGYSVVQELPWSDNAVIVRASSGTLADTLKGIDKLEALPGVENVEPQMISKRSKR